MNAKDYLLNYANQFNDEVAENEVYVTLRLDNKLYGFKVNGSIDPDMPIHEDGHQAGFNLGEIDVSGDFEPIK